MVHFSSGHPARQTTASPAERAEILRLLREIDGAAPPVERPSAAYSAPFPRQPLVELEGQGCVLATEIVAVLPFTARPRNGMRTRVLLRGGEQIFVHTPTEAVVSAWKEAL